MTRLVRVAAVAGAAICSMTIAGRADAPVTVGIVLKTLSNPYFIAVGDAAKAEAKKQNANAIVVAGKYDGDNSSQISEVDDLVTRGAKTIAIIPNLSAGIVPAVKRAQAAGVKIIAVDTALDPISLSDTFIATDNLKAGVMNGKWAKSAMGKTTAKIVLLEGTPGSQVNTDRMQGFLNGFGADAKKLVVADQITNGDQGKAQTAMENVLAAHADANLVWTINEPAALGAATAIKARGLTGKIKVVSMDGSCRGLQGVDSGAIDSDVMQFPKKMGAQAVDFAVDAAHGKAIPKTFDTGEVLVTKSPQSGVASQPVAYGLKNCW